MVTPGEAIPSLGLGTYGLTGAAGLAAMGTAIRLGYRHLDTAQTYGTEANVGRAVRDSGLPRSALFVTTKITARNLLRLEDSLRDSLAEMGLEQVDLCLIHWPAPGDEPPVAAYIRALAQAQDLGLCRLIGVSNYTRRHLDEAIAVLGEGRIATNQVEQHVYLQNRVLERHCTERGVRLTAYMPLAGGEAASDPVLTAIAARHGATANQVALAWLLARGSVAIPKATAPERQKSNLAAAALRLTPGDMDEIAALDRGRRFIDPGWGPDWD